MKLLSISTGLSFKELGHKLSRLDPDIKTIGLHRVFPYIKEVHNIDLDYWTWADPNAVTDGLDYLKKNPNVKVPQIIIPKWLETLERFNKEVTYYDTSDYFRSIYDYLYNAKSAGFKVYPIIFSDNRRKKKIKSLNDIFKNDSLNSFYPHYKKQRFYNLLLICKNFVIS